MEWVDRFRGQFDGEWDKYREDTLERQEKLGVVPPDTQLTVRSEGLPAWDDLSAGQKQIYARMMEVFDGYAAHCDHEMGRIIDAVKQMPGADNTSFIYIVGDNGASAEGGIEGSINENLFFNGFPEKWQDNLKHIDDLGGPKFFNHFPSAWAHAMCTPFQWTKQVASHFGGTRNPMVVSYPARIKAKSPRVLNNSWTISAVVDVPDKGEGMIVTHGGMPGGYGCIFATAGPRSCTTSWTSTAPPSPAQSPCPRARRNSWSTVCTTASPASLPRAGNSRLSRRSRFCCSDGKTRSVFTGHGLPRLERTGPTRHSENGCGRFWL